MGNTLLGSYLGRRLGVFLFPLLGSCCCGKAWLLDVEKEAFVIENMRKAGESWTLFVEKVGSSSFCKERATHLDLSTSLPQPFHILFHIVSATFPHRFRILSASFPHPFHKLSTNFPHRFRDLSTSLPQPASTPFSTKEAFCCEKGWLLDVETKALLVEASRLLSWKLRPFDVEKRLVAMGPAQPLTLLRPLPCNTGALPAPQRAQLLYTLRYIWVRLKSLGMQLAPGRLSAT